MTQRLSKIGNQPFGLFRYIRVNNLERVIAQVSDFFITNFKLCTSTTKLDRNINNPEITKYDGNINIRPHHNDYINKQQVTETTKN